MKVTSKLIYGFAILSLVFGCVRNDKATDVTPAPMQTKDNNSFEYTEPEVLAIMYPNFESEEYKSLPDTTVDLNPYDNFGGVKIQSKIDNLHVEIDYGEYVPIINNYFFNTITPNQYEAILNQDEVVELPLLLCEGLPEYRIRVYTNDYESSKLMVYESLIDEINQIELYPVEIYPIDITYNYDIHPIIRSAALFRYLELKGEIDLEYRYWGSISYALLCDDPPLEPFGVEIDEWLIDEIIKSMYPYEVMAERVNDIPAYNPEAEYEYTIYPVNEIFTHTAEVYDFEYPEDGKQIVYIKITDISDNTEDIMEVQLEVKDDLTNTPYYFKIYDITFAQAKG